MVPIRVTSGALRTHNITGALFALHNLSLVVRILSYSTRHITMALATKTQSAALFNKLKQKPANKASLHHHLILSSF